MRIPNEKQKAFLKKLIEDTKSHTVLWEPMLHNCIASMQTFSNDNLDPEGVFSCVFPQKLSFIFLIALCDNDNVKGSIGADYDHMIPLDDNDINIEVLLKRLFNLIIENRPNANKFIDEYLSLSENSAEDNGQ